MGSIKLWSFVCAHHRITPSYDSNFINQGVQNIRKKDCKNIIKKKLRFMVLLVENRKNLKSHLKLLTYKRDVSLSENNVNSGVGIQIIVGFEIKINQIFCVLKLID